MMEVCRLQAAVSRSSLSGHDFYLEELRPQLAGHKQPILHAIIGNPVQHGLGVESVHGRHQTSQIDPASNASRLWRNSSDSIRVPDVCVNLTTNVLELV